MERPASDDFRSKANIMFSNLEEDETSKTLQFGTPGRPIFSADEDVDEDVEDEDLDDEDLDDLDEEGDEDEDVDDEDEEDDEAVEEEEE